MNGKQTFTFSIVCLTLILWWRPVLSEAQDSINIGAIFSLTGKATNANRSSVLGTRLAVDEINEKGGLLNRRINLIFLDNMSTPIGSSIAANQAVAAGVIGIIGAAWSSHSLAIAEVAQENRIPMISNLSTNPKVTHAGEYVFRVCFTDDFQGKVMAEFAINDLNGKSAVIFVELTSDYSLGLAGIFRSHFESLGGTIVEEIEYKSSNEDHAAIARPAVNLNADVIFLSGHDESGRIAHQLQIAGVRSILLGGDGWGTESFLIAGGRHLKRGYFCTHWSKSSTHQASRQFSDRYSNHPDFGTGAALAFDAVMVLARSIESAGSTNREVIQRNLQKLSVYEGVTGSIKFDANGDPLKSAVIMEILNGRPRYLKTLDPS